MGVVFRHHVYENHSLKGVVLVLLMRACSTVR